MSDSSKLPIAYVGLGSNLGDREAYLHEGIRLLNETDGVHVLRISDIYETEPVGYTDQPAFLNMAAAVETRLTPEELLEQLLDIEQRLGRVRHIRWGPRTVDLDLLMYEQLTMDTPRLTLPHPRMQERAFVLVPLLDVVEEGAIAGMANALLQCPGGREGITRWTNTH